MTLNKPVSKRLFVGSLPYKFTEGELLSLFVSEGKIIAVRIIHNRWGRSRGMGYVEFEKEEDAVRAKNKFHNFLLEDRTIIVDYAQPDPFLTPEGRARHEEALKKHPQRNQSAQRFNLSNNNVSPKKRIRQSVFNSRNFGSRIGAKFASRNKKRK